MALFGANYLFDGHVIGMFIFPSIIALIVGFIGLRFGSDSPESYGLGKAEELFGEEISEEDKETEENEMTKWQIFVEYVLKNKVNLAAVLLQHLPVRGAYWYRPVVYRLRIPGTETF
ncbi:sugar phosphate antiporter [Citrobacter koseri]|uniref:Sugar phosphate antiporter n=1 Tax=Citrobacter koseri TaxID=545 RepID=A0A2X2YSB0_CITKO|nr:sugar phosphate antiporter [Citrobacter koseri]